MRPRLARCRSASPRAVYGAWLLLDRRTRTSSSAAAIWLVAGVVLHDGVLAPLVAAALAWLAPRLLPRAGAGPGRGRASWCSAR